MSKSKGNVLYADQLVEKFGVDGVRYYVLAEMPYAQDGSITYEQLVGRYNADLANTVGNLVNRTVAMTQKYFDGQVFPPATADPLDKQLADAALEAVRQYRAAMDEFRVADAIDAVLALARRSNKYIDETAPWVLAKTDEGRERLKSVLYNLLEAIRFLAVLLQPVMPGTAEEISRQTGCPLGDLSAVQAFGLRGGDKVGDPIPLFARIDEKKFFAALAGEAAQTAKDAAKAKKAGKAEQKAEKKADRPIPEGCIGMEDFTKVELRAAKVLLVEPVPKSDKLLRLELDDGMGGRQIVSGIAPWYTPAQLTGRTIVVVSNLAPAKLRGVVSQGMLLASDVGDAARVVFLDDDVPAGARLH